MVKTEAKNIINKLLDQHQGEAVLVVAGSPFEITEALSQEALMDNVSLIDNALVDLVTNSPKFRDELIERILTRAAL